MTARALIIAWDGVRYDRLADCDLPVLGKITADGFLQQTQMPSSSEAATSTAPGWSTNLTGVWPAKHGITDNVAMPHRLETYPHLLQRYLTARPERQTLACVSAAMLGSTKGPGPILGTGVTSLIFHDVRTHPLGPIGRDPMVYADAVHHLTASDQDETLDYDLGFVYFAGTDKTAHQVGTTGSQYREAIEREDAWTGGLLDAIRSRSTYADEDWLIVVTTDHGHLDEGGHGGDSWQERQAWIAMCRLSGSLDFAPPADLANVDIAPTVLGHLGVPTDPSWDLDGRALITAG